MACRPRESLGSGGGGGRANRPRLATGCLTELGGRLHHVRDVGMGRAEVVVEVGSVPWAIVCRARPQWLQMARPGFKVVSGWVASRVF